jgi:hypothetical protein
MHYSLPTLYNAIYTHIGPISYNYSHHRLSC